MFRRLPCLAWVICCLILSPAVFAQSERATVSGTVSDASGAVIPGARVTVTNNATNVTSVSTTTESGDYTVPSLPVGQYTVRVEKEGFKPAVRNEVTLNAATVSRLNVVLEIGTSQQAIEITANAVQLMTESAKSSVTVTNKLMDELPLVVGGALRSPFDLALLTPEAKNFGDNNFIIGGGQASSYGTSLDGVSTNTTRALQVSWVSVNAPSVDAITEFTVDSNGFKAEYGHAGGGNITFVSKSGTNQFHGAVYEFLRNNALDANRFFSNSAGLPRAIYKQSDFGVSAGGPVWIPKIIHGKDKTFFFAAYEGFRNRNGATSRTVSVPTAEMYDGDFSNWVDINGRQIPIYDYNTQRVGPDGKLVRDQFAGNKIPSGRFDPLSKKLLGVYQTSGVLKPNNGAAPGTSAYVRANYLITQGTVTQPQNKFSIKGDHLFSEKNRLSGYFGRNRSAEQPGPAGPNTLPGLYTDYNDLTRNSDVYRLSWDHTFSPSLLNHFYAGGNNWRENHNPPQELIGNWKDKFCLPNVPDCNENLANLRFSEYQGWGGAANNGSENTIYSFNDELTWIRGRHSFKAGAMYQRNHYNGFGRQDIAGRGDFNFKETGVPGDKNFTTAGGNSFASFLLGYADNGGLDTIRFIGQQWPYYAGFFQDDWRVNPKLTLNLGVRWETTLPPVEESDRWTDFSPTRANPRAGNLPGALIYAGSGPGREGSRTLADSYFKAFGPHIGFAYSWNDKTVVRGSYARSFATITTVTGSTHQQGFTLTRSFDNLQTDGVQPTFLFKDGLPAWQAPPFIDPSFANGQSINWWQGREATRPPENNTWNLSVQRQLTGSLLLEASYNGLVGSHLQSGLLQYDQVDPKYLTTLGPTLLSLPYNDPAAVAAGIRAPFPGFAGSVAQALRPYPQFSGINTLSGGGDHSGHSSYHAGILRLEKRYSSGLTFLSSYVFSKLLTDSDSYWASDFRPAADHYNRRLEKSIGAFDVTHNFKLGVVYDLPFGKGKKLLSSGVGSVILGGWRVSTLQFYSSGLPVGLSSGVSLPGLGGRTAATVATYDNWQGAVAHGSFDPATDRFFQPASFFGTQPKDRIGNSTRYNPRLRQFPSYTENLSLAKTFSFTEQIRLDFRFEAFNVLNRVRFGVGPTDWFNTASLSNPNFGKLTSNGDLLNSPRQMQFGLKLYW